MAQSWLSSRFYMHIDLFAYHHQHLRHLHHCTYDATHMSPPRGAREAANALSIEPPPHSPASPPVADLDPRQAMPPSPPDMASPSREPPSLPDRQVTADSIEDAYVRFILYCNPALPPDADTASLREAFRSPPRSGGKVFQPFTIFGLVTRFYAREIKTWTELARLLGVEPPDLAKDESAQKIAQYGVRLKVSFLGSMALRRSRNARNG